MKITKDHVEHLSPVCLDWNDMSKLGLIERINTEILHPLGLAMSRNVETGVSEEILISEDGLWEYAPNRKSTIISDDEVKAKIKLLQSP